MKLKRFTTQLVAAGLITVPLMVQAAGLGKMSVNSALGQPLAAEIELFAADKAELESLSASLASDQAFRDANVEFAPVLSSLRFTVETKPNGKSVLKVTSNRPVNDPFVDMLIELNWASGRLVREYTMLLDPPGMAPQQSVTPVVVAPVRPPVTRRAPAPVAEQAPAASRPAAPVAAKAPVPAAPKAAEPAAQSAAAPDQVTVRRGDTLSRIAWQVKPAGVSLEQTLVGLYRDNPRAFDGNMNRMKAGTTLAVPSSEKAASIAQQDAVREIKLQSDDWRAYRQSLAGKVQEAPAAKPEPTQASSGKLTPKVEDRAKPAPEAQKDVLKLSKVTPPATAAAGKLDEKRAAQEKQDKLRALEEDAIARQKALKESEQRAAMLEKQIQDAQKLIEMKEKANTAAAPGPAVVAAAPVVPVPAPAPVVQKPAPVAAVEAPAESTENWFTPLLANPLYWGGALVALGLGGALWWMMAGGSGRRRKTGTALDDSIMSGGDVRPTSVIGGAASGGSINTGDTSFLTDFSQAGLGTIDTHDVDPIAEAEVYMAYGRDAQAEEILKEAISKNPDRPEVRVKLLEVYAARRNTAAFESVAGELYAALGNKQSPLWDKACEMGRSIDPTNPLYGGVQSAAPAVAVGTVAATDVIAGGAVAVEPEPFAAAPFGAVADEMKEPDFEPVAESDPVTNAPFEFESAGHVLNFDAQPAAVAAPADLEADTHGLDFDLPDLDLPASATDDLKLDLDLGLEEDNGPVSKFDFSGLDLDLGDSGGNELELDEVGTKLDLARAYVEMGDKEGAREILTEVLAEGSDKQIADAKGLMSSLA
ncbi:MAG TPA: FimV/HubP family polar landmark protein [Thiobacillus sp.]|nr:FimV/HubP family polar landmark protein [Thiobacillus sp.]HQT71319.1 FimV/HubP family polar landmark protein [Thiobacillus sp.]